MDILIKNIELPKDDEHGFILVFTKGLVVDFTSCKVIKAIELEEQLISVDKVCDYLSERADTSKEMGDDGTASLFTSMIGDILAISIGVYNG